jgi:hypothetical protein
VRRKFSLRILPRRCRGDGSFRRRSSRVRARAGRN